MSSVQGDSAEIVNEPQSDSVPDSPVVSSLHAGALAGLAAGAIMTANFRSPGEEIFEGRAALLGLFVLGVSTIGWQTRRTTEGGRGSALVAGAFFFLLSAASGIAVRDGGASGILAFIGVVALVGLLLGMSRLVGAHRWLAILLSIVAIAIGLLVRNASLLARLHQAGGAFAAGAFIAALAVGGRLDVRKWASFAASALVALVLALV